LEYPDKSGIISPYLLNLGLKVHRNLQKKYDGTIPLHNPKSVPLCGPNELDFYRTLQSAGHEIALPSPSETSNTREEVIAAWITELANCLLSGSMWNSWP
jgi:hypothetical protein